MPKVSVILPVYNEGKVIRDNARSLERVLSGCLDDFEIIISENGSTDDTVPSAKSLVSESARIRVLHERRRLGKGAAIKAAAENCKGDIVIFMDADLASAPGQAKRLVDEMKGDAAIVVGSRYLRNSRARRKPLRDAASRSFNWLVRNMLGSRLSDHQCGFKSFRRSLVLPIIREIEDQTWFWDTELLVRAQRGGLRIVELPIEWNEADDSKFRLVEDSIRMGLALVAFRLKNGGSA